MKTTTAAILIILVAIVASIGLALQPPSPAASTPVQSPSAEYTLGSLRWPVLKAPTLGPTQSLVMKLDAKGYPWVMLYEFDGGIPAGDGRAARFMAVKDGWQLAARLDPETRAWTRISQQEWQQLKAEPSLFPLTAELEKVPRDPRPVEAIKRTAATLVCKVTEDAVAYFQWSYDWRFLAETGLTQLGPDDPNSAMANVGLPLYPIIVDRTLNTTTVWKLTSDERFAEFTQIGWSEDASIFAVSAWSPRSQLIWFIHPKPAEPASPAPNSDSPKEPQR